MVLAPAQPAEALRADLLACGVGRVVAADMADPAATACAIADLAGAARSLVVAIDDDTAGAVLAAAEAACRHLAVPLLRGSRAGQMIEIGPVFYAGHTACLACFRRGTTEFSRPGGTHSRHGLGAPNNEWAADHALAAMLADEALAVLGAVRAIRALSAVTMTSLADGSERRLLVVPDPDCAVCGTCFPSAVPTDYAATYEWEVQYTPRWLRTPGPVTALLQPGARNLVSERPYFAAGPSFQFRDTMSTAQSGGAGSPAPPAARLDLLVLGDVLARSAGRREPRDPTDFSRWAPSGGNLASVRLFVAACGAGFGPVAGQLTAYDDIEHRLITVRATPVPPERLLTSTGLAPADPCAVLVFTADVARIARKYSSFGYRLAHLDAGVAATQLAVVAGDLGLRVQFAPAWHGQLDSVLALRLNEEFVTAVALVTQEDRAYAAGCCASAGSRRRDHRVCTAGAPPAERTAARPAVGT